MAWTQDQINQLIEEFWKNRQEVAYCPECGVMVHLNFAAVAGDYLLSMECPNGHGDFTANRKDDPKASQFRPWTKEELTKIINDHQKNRIAYCPVDGMFLISKDGGTSGGTIYTADCPRCGNFDQRILSNVKP